MVKKDKVISVLTELCNQLNESNPKTDITNYLNDSLVTLKKSEGVAFTGQLQTFFDHAPVEKMSTNVTFTASEEKLWDKLLSLNQVGNNLWGLFI